MADEIFLVNSSSFQDVEISASLRSGPGITVDFSKALQVSGTFVGEGSSLTQVSASYIIVNSNTTASQAMSASWAPVPASASFASQSISASNAVTSSWASASFLSTTSSWAATCSVFIYSNTTVSLTFVTSASWASQSLITISSSYASESFFATTASFSSRSISSSWVPNLYPQTEQVSSSWSSASFVAMSASFASKSISSSYVPNLYPQTEQISASWSSASFVAASASFASKSISASFVPNLYPQTEQISSSWSSASFVAASASFASRSISASYAPFTQTEQISASWSSASFVATSASFASRSFVATSASFSSASFVATSASFSNTSFTSVSSTTASWSSASFVSLSSSFGSASISASYSLTASSAVNAFLATTATTATSATTATAATSASWTSASFVSLSSSFASASISASYSLTASSAVNAFLATTATTATTATSATSAISASWTSASFVATSASFASKSISASYAPFTQTEQVSGSWASASFFATSASFASRSISASYSLTASSAVNAFLATTATSATTATAATSASWSSASFVASSASFASQSISASWAPPVASNFAISASWASASFVATSASFASQSISASWAPPVASNFAISASWASASLSASLAILSSISASGGNFEYPMVFVLNSGSNQPMVDSADRFNYNPSLDRFSATNITSSVIIGQVRTGLNVRQFGATGDGTTDDTVAIQQALSASWTSGVSNRGVDLFFPGGVYRTSAPISCSGNNVTLVGAGVGGTALYPQHTTGNVLEFGSNAVGVASVGITNMSLICPTARTSGATILVNNADDVLISNFNITNYFEGIRVTGSSIKVKIDNGVLSAGAPQSGSGILISNGLAGDTYVSNIVSSNSPSSMPLAGIQINQTGHTSLIRNNITSAQYGLYVNPVASQDVTYLFCDHSLFDSCMSSSFYVNPAASNTARVRSAVFVNSWFAGTISGSGITISGVQNAGGSNSPIIDDYRFIGCRVLNNYRQGVHISNSGSTGNLAFQNCTFAGNSQQSSSQWSAIEIDKNVTGSIGVTGNRIGQAGTAGNTQRHAILVPDSTGSMNIRFNNNSIFANVIPPYINIGVMTGSVIIADNAGDESTGVSAKSLPISSSATSGAGETLLFNYRVPANSVRVGQYYRIRVIGQSSSTGTLIFRVRVGSAGTTGDTQAWISTTSAAQTANSRAGFEALLCVRSIGSSGTAYVDGLAHASALVLGTSVAAPATAAINTTNNWFIDVCATCSTGTYTVQVATIDAL